MAEFCKLPDLANRLGLPLRTIQSLAKRGEIPGAFKVGKLWMFRNGDVDRWIDDQIAHSQSKRLASSNYRRVTYRAPSVADVDDVSRDQKALELKLAQWRTKHRERMRELCRPKKYIIE